MRQDVPGGDAVATLVVTQERFQAGDFPMVCARSGRPADRLLAVDASRSRPSMLPLLLLGVVPALLWWLLTRRRPAEWTGGHLPFATGRAEPVTAVWSKRRQVVRLLGVHPAFVTACRTHQPG